MIYKFIKSRFKSYEIEIYDSIHQLPVLRFQKFNKYQIMAAEIGNDFMDYERRTEKTLSLLQKNMVAEAIQELNNRRQTVWNALEEQSPTAASFAVLVHRIDNVKYEGYAPDDLDRILQHLEEIGFDAGSMVDQLVEAKKKINLELGVYYPDFFPKDGNKDEIALRYKQIQIVLDQCEKQDFELMATERFDVEKEILEGDKPNVWNVHEKGNMERALEVDFQKFAIMVSELSGGHDLDKMTTHRFYATVEHLNEKNAPKK